MERRFKGKSKTAYVLDMLRILQTGQKYKKKELAELLDDNSDSIPFNPRNIVEYKKELESLGYVIDENPGREGGYVLNKGKTMPMVNLSNEERDSIVDAIAFIRTKPDFYNEKGFLLTMGKICSSLMINIDNEQNSSTPKLISSNKITSGISYETVARYYQIVHEAIRKRKQLKIMYDWLKEEPQVLIVEPYELFLCDNEWRFYARVEDFEKEVPLKLTRILQIDTLPKSFVPNRYFKLGDHFKNGIFLDNGEMITITLIASGVRAKLFKEKVYGLNQVCEDLTCGKTKVMLDMQDNYSTYNFILGCGDLVEVTEPEWLREKIKNIATNIAKKYVQKS